MLPPCPSSSGLAAVPRGFSQDKTVTLVLEKQQRHAGQQPRFTVSVPTEGHTGYAGRSVQCSKVTTATEGTIIWVKVPIVTVWGLPR